MYVFLSDFGTLLRRKSVRLGILTDETAGSFETSVQLYQITPKVIDI
jgi:hypothetical protein